MFSNFDIIDRFFKDDDPLETDKLKRVSSVERLPLNPHHTAEIISTAIKNLSIQQQQEQDANEINNEQHSASSNKHVINYASTVIIQDYPEK